MHQSSTLLYYVKCQRIQEFLSERQTRYLRTKFFHGFTGCDTVSAIAGHGKTTLFDRFCALDIDEHMDILQPSKDAVMRNVIMLFYHAPGTALAIIRYSMSSRKAAAELTKLETLLTTEGAAAQHSLCAYLQTHDWMLLQSMSLDPVAMDGAVGSDGYEPISTLDPMVPEELLKFINCGCKQPMMQLLEE